MTSPAERLCSRSWRLRNSLWIAPVILLAGVATWASFLYIGLKTKRKSWLVAAGIFGAGAVLIFTLTAIFNDGSKQTTSPGETVSGLVIVIVWITGIIYAIKSNREWLKWKAHVEPTAAWYADPAERPAAPPSEPTADDLLLGRSTPPAPWMTPEAQASTTGPLPPPPVATFAQSPNSAAPPSVAPTLGGHAAESGRLVDLNSASAADLEGGLGLDRAVAERVVLERARLGRFTDVEQLMTVAGLEPHVFAGIRHHTTVGAAPIPSGPSAPGRRLDL